MPPRELTSPFFRRTYRFITYVTHFDAPELEPNHDGWDPPESAPVGQAICIVTSPLCECSLRDKLKDGKKGYSLYSAVKYLLQIGEAIKKLTQGG